MIKMPGKYHKKGKCDELKILSIEKRRIRDAVMKYIRTTEPTKELQRLLH